MDLLTSFQLAVVVVLLSLVVGYSLVELIIAKYVGWLLLDKESNVKPNCKPRMYWRRVQKK